MPASVRLNDPCSGHGPCSSRNNDQGSPDVFVNDLPVHRVTDHWPTHCLHDGQASGGSPNVFANDLARCRVGDPVDCGSTMVEGSPDVFIN